MLSDELSLLHGHARHLSPPWGQNNPLSCKPVLHMHTPGSGPRVHWMCVSGRRLRDDAGQAIPLSPSPSSHYEDIHRSCVCTGGESLCSCNGQAGGQGNGSLSLIPKPAVELENSRDSLLPSSPNPYSPGLPAGPVLGDVPDSSLISIQDLLIPRECFPTCKRHNSEDSI